MIEVLLGALQPRMSALVDILRECARLTGAHSCVLWREQDDELLWVADSQPEGVVERSYRLPISQSITGAAVRSARQCATVDLHASPMRADPFRLDPQIRSFCVTPLVFADGARGALNLYRTTNHNFDDDALSRAREAASLMPLLYELIHDRVAFHLLRDVDTIASDMLRRPGEVDEALRQVCEAVGTALNALDVTILLEQDPGQYDVVATTQGMTPRTSFRADPADRITGWALRHPDNPVRLVDLPGDSSDAERYPGLEWRDFIASMQDRLGHRPLSIMTASILRGDHVLGLIRCSVGRGPVYFSDQAHDILLMVARRVAATWNAILDRRELDEENACLARLVRETAMMNQRARDMIGAGEDSNALAQCVLQVARAVLPVATMNDVRLLTPDRRELVIAAGDGPAWTTSARAAAIRTSVDGVLATSAVQRENDEWFAEATSAIYAPVGLGEEVLGVLDLRTNASRGFPPIAIHVATLLGTQLAHYLKTLLVVGELRKVLDEIRDMNESRFLMTEDMLHQLRSPLLTAQTRVQEALDVVTRDSALRDIGQQLLIVRGTCRRASHVTANAQLFITIAKRQPIEVNVTRISGTELIALLINSGTDVSAMHTRLPRSPRDAPLWRRASPLSPTRRPFNVVTAPFEAIEMFLADPALLEQAITQILDNAFKYSFEDSVVEISGGYTHPRRQGPRRLRISVTSRGVRIEREEVPLVRNRGFQGAQAATSGQGGSGIGLWIVDQIMAAMKGSLEIQPTDRDGRTTISLILPVE